MEDYFTYNYFTEFRVDISSNEIKNAMKTYSKDYPTELFITKMLCKNKYNEDCIRHFYVMNGYDFVEEYTYEDFVKSYKILNTDISLDLRVNIPIEDFKKQIKNDDYLEIECEFYTFSKNRTKKQIIKINLSKMRNIVQKYKVYNKDTKEEILISLPTSVNISEFLKSAKKALNDNTIYEIEFSTIYNDSTYLYKDVLFEDYDNSCYPHYVLYNDECYSCGSNKNLYITLVSEEPYVKQVICFDCIKNKRFKLTYCDGNSDCLELCTCKCMDLDHNDEYVYLTNEDKCTCGHEECIHYFGCRFCVHGCRH